MRFNGRLIILASVVISSSALIGCNPIEQRAEKIKKSPLPTLSQSMPKAAKLWSYHGGKGVGKLDAKLQLGMDLALGTVFEVDYQGHLTALDESTGKIKWRTTTVKPVTAGVAATKAAVAIGTEEGVVEVLAIDDGHSLWKKTVETPVMALSITKQAVYVHGANDSVYALDIKDGQELWQYQANTPPIMFRQVSNPVLAANKVLVGFSNGKLIAFDSATGLMEWEKEIAVSKGRSDIQRMVDVNASPVVVDKTVYAVGYQGRVVALDLETGTSLWEKDLSSFSGLAVNKTTVFISDATGIVWALKRQSGEVLWQQAGLSGRVLTAPVVVENHLITADEEGYIHWLDPKNGDFISRARIDSAGVETTPVVIKDKLFALSRSGKITAYRLGN